jgi:hypothetical protein
MRVKVEKHIHYDLYFNLTEEDRQKLTTEIDTVIGTWRRDEPGRAGLFLLPELYNKLMEIGGE